ncbi:MAG: FAD-dependent oxidoreductase [Betaproteobacteria bacterium]|nr:FAD-dependent oxidoreductase [Betaproteobacteria bacterium]MBU6512937.1 FAD-dependent oxidoreductase [Betaproteobacteria bacterium]MDE1955946.1 FAD-dependent oxidoreductase [Betaproteobacteria bacterium]MDE2151867.1 FAD-dependent oxidoreductase [Betaproteobacteria bacterium]
MNLDCIVIGGGPAGMAAALGCASHGLRTALVDEQPRPGGQIYRNVGRAAPEVGRLLGKDYLRGAPLVECLERSGVQVHRGALVWDVAEDLTVSVLAEGRSLQMRAPRLLVATGALERPSPVPGWTLPRVMSAGAAQIALKTSASVPDGRVVLVGCGPLLLLVACQLLDAGAMLAGILETAPAANRREALRHLPRALAAPEYLLKGLRMVRRLRAARVPFHTGVSQVRIEGTDAASGVRFVCKGREHRLAADVVLLHHGVVPNTQLSRLLRIEHAWDEGQLAWRPVVDAWGRSSRPGVHVLGDGAGISGALAAQLAGEVAALDVACTLGRITQVQRDRLAAPWFARRRRQHSVRPFLDALYRPPAWIACPPDDTTIVCRCEEVTAGRVREMASLGCRGPNQTKFFSRCGMGPCQGRMCGLTVTQLLAQQLDLEPAEVGAYHVRSPIKPIPLSAFATMTFLDGDASHHEHQDRALSTRPTDE